MHYLMSLGSTSRRRYRNRPSVQVHSSILTFAVALTLQPNAAVRLSLDPLMQYLGAVGDSLQLTDLGVIPRQLPYLQHNPPPVEVVGNDSVGSNLTGCSRSNILQSAFALCSAHVSDMPLDKKVDNMMSVMGCLVQLLLLEHRSGETSPATNHSWITATASDASGAKVEAPAKAGAVKPFRCPVCPGSKRLTEKGFQKHVKAWRQPKAVSKKRRKKASCPGIFNSQYVRSQVTHGFNASDVVNSVVDGTLDLLTPGANAAHGQGTGNHFKVNTYFSSMFPPNATQ